MGPFTEKGWLIKTNASNAGISAASLSRIERKSEIRITTLSKLAIILEHPVWFLGCCENIPEDTFLQCLEKARCYHGHSKEQLAKVFGINQRTIFTWKVKKPNIKNKENLSCYMEILNDK